MSDIFDIEALPNKKAATPKDQIPQKWQEHKATDWYRKLREIKQARKIIIKDNPTDLTETSCPITLAQLSEAMGKHKSHLAPSKWKKQSTALEKSKAFIVKELDKTNERLLRDWKLAVKNRKQVASPAKRKAALARELEEALKRIDEVEDEDWKAAFRQVNHDSSGLANKVADLERKLEEAKESSDNQRRTHQEMLRSRTRDMAEIKRLEELNAALLAELKGAKEVNEKLKSAASGVEGRLAPPPKCVVDISSPPASINPVAWTEWIEYRAKSRKKVSAAAAEKQWKDLSKLSHAAQADIINASIANDWQGLFPAKKTGAGTRERSLKQDLTDTSWADAPESASVTPRADVSPPSKSAKLTHRNGVID